MNSVINIYKEAGMTSFQVVAQVRKLVKGQKCGHTGTLDPMAEGVLPICFGGATRFSEIFMAGDKQYIAEFKLGEAYDTYDTTGEVVSKSDVVPTYEQVEAALNSLVGDTELVVSAFSAKKIDGKRAYDLARDGKIEDAGTAIMSIYSIKLLDYEYPYGKFVVDCGKGTYVRSIIHTAGEILKSYAAMSSLVRSKSGPFLLEDAVKLDVLNEDGMLEKHLIDVVDKLDMQKIVLSTDYLLHISNGMQPSKASYIDYDSFVFKEAEDCLVISEGGKLIALGVHIGGGRPIKLSKVFIKPEEATELMVK